MEYHQAIDMMKRCKEEIEKLELELKVEVENKAKAKTAASLPDDGDTL